MRSRPNILMPIAAGFTAVLIVMVIIIVASFGEPGGLANWLGLGPVLGNRSQESPALGMPPGQVIAIVGLLIALLAIAITTRLTQRNENALIAQMEQVEGTLDALSQAVIRIDRRGLVTYLNPAARKLLGEESGQMPATLKLIDMTTRQPLLDSLLDGANKCDQSSLPQEARLVTKQGMELEVEGSCRQVRDAQGKVMVAILLLRDVTEEREWMRRQPDLWDRDSLTALPGRNFMLNRLSRLLERERAGERPITYIRITLHGIPDAYRESGAKAGDAMVRHLAALLRPLIRDTDVLARMDTDTFGALLTLCPEEIGNRIAADIHDTLSAGQFHWDGTSYPIRAEIGMVRIPPFEGTAEELLEAASAHA